jgi:hypothetical protein
MVRMKPINRLNIRFAIPLLALCLLGSTAAQQHVDFSGSWALKIGDRVLFLITLEPAPGSFGQFTGKVVHPLHVNATDDRFDGISGPTTHYAIVRGNVKENCFTFVTKNPRDASDEDNYQICVTGNGTATLSVPDAPGLGPWPLTKVTSTAAVATNWDSCRSYFQDDTDVSNPEMKKIFDADQGDRQLPNGKIDWAVVDKSDAERRVATRKLLAEDKLHTGEDFSRAAFVFQHGESPDDFLLAHTLAMIAVSKGKHDALWIATATLDRYLNSIKQPQIFGTQFHLQNPTTQEPYNRMLISDALRRQLGVPSLAAQEQQRKKYDEESSHQ